MRAVNGGVGIYAGVPALQLRDGGCSVSRGLTGVAVRIHLDAAPAHRLARMRLDDQARRPCFAAC